VAQEADAYELTFVGFDGTALATPLLASHPGQRRMVGPGLERAPRPADRELADAGARLVALSPVRSTLEEFVLRHYEGGGR